jgi:hypothetical protein
MIEWGFAWHQRFVIASDLKPGALSIRTPGDPTVGIVETK